MEAYADSRHMAEEDAPLDIDLLTASLRADASDLEGKQ